MPTQFSNTLHMSNTAAADFQAWISFIDTLLTAGGWVNTADTGQLVIGTAVPPAGTNTKVGYRVYRMNDALQATAPVFLRIDFGSYNTAATPGIWLTIGTGSNGAGAITGVLFNGGASAVCTVTSGANGVNACNSYGSAASGRVHLLMFVRAGANDVMFLSLERSKDANGADTADGLLFVWQSSNTGMNNSLYIIATPGTQPPTEAGVSFLLSTQTASAFNANVGVGLPILFKGFAQQPGVGCVVVNSGDFLAEAQFQISLYGAVRTFQLGQGPTNQCVAALGGGGGSIRGSSRIGIRYD